MDEKKTESVAQQTAATVAARGDHCPSQQQSRLSSQSNSIDLIRDGKTNKKNILRSAFSLHDSSHARQSTKGKKLNENHNIIIINKEKANNVLILENEFSHVHC